jgi:hypothetical protein
MERSNHFKLGEVAAAMVQIGRVAIDAGVSMEEASAALRILSSATTAMPTVESISNDEEVPVKKVPAKKEKLVRLIRED